MNGTNWPSHSGFDTRSPHQPVRIKLQTLTPGYLGSNHSFIPYWALWPLSALVSSSQKWANSNSYLSVLWGLLGVIKLEELRMVCIKTVWGLTIFMSFRSLPPNLCLNHMHSHSLLELLYLSCTTACNFKTSLASTVCAGCCNHGHGQHQGDTGQNAYIIL